MMSVYISQAQASWEQFGQNRVQYRTFSWKYYDSTHFRAFYYDYGKANAIYALNMAEQELSHIVYMMGGRLHKKLNIILYNSFGDYRQTNLGRKNDEINQASGGKVDVAGDNIPIYFNGDHNHLKKQIRSGIAKAIKDNMLFGDNLKDVVKNAVKMNLPEWYTLGYVSFIADSWSAEKQTSIQNLIATSGKKSFLDMAIEQPTLCGHAFWNFISNEYGENYISNLLYLTRYRKSVTQAIEIVYKKTAKELYKEFVAYYALGNANAQNDTLPVLGRTIYTKVIAKRGAVYSNFSVSPSGRELAYVEKKEGQFKIYIQDVKYNKSYVIIDGGMKALQELEDPDYPMICWSPSGKKLAALYQRKGALQLRIFTTGKRIMEKRRIAPNKIDRITGMCFTGDESSLAVTAIKKGQSDLYKLTIKNNRFENITNDMFDDKSPSYVENGLQSGILFLSNRTTPFLSNSKSEIFNNQFNAYLYSPSRGTNLLQLSATQHVIHDAVQYGPEKFSYLEDKQGEMHRVVVSISKRGTQGDTIEMQQAAPTTFSILGQEFIHQKGKLAEVSRNGNEYIIYATIYDSLENLDKAYQKLTQSMLDTIKNSNVEEGLVEKPSEYITPFDAETDSVQYLSNLFLNPQSVTSRFQTFVSTSTVGKAKIYRSNFYPDYIQTSLDNTLLFTRYQPLGTQFNNVPLSGFLTSTLTDVMEDYKLTGGARLGIDFRSLDYFLQFANYRRRVDWGLLYFHSNTTEQGFAPPPYYSPYYVIGKKGMDYLQSNFTYPIDMLKSFRTQIGLRYDRTRYLAKDQYSIEIPNSKQYWLVTKLEYVYDNTINPMLNIWKGSRAKIFVEYQYQFNDDKKGFVNFGYDARNYITLYKNFILASRLAGAHSTGKAKILYYLGGVDNSLSSQFDQNTQLSSEETYAFQSLATNLRGYKQGARNGSSFMVLNEELRLPIYNTFFKRQIKSGFIRNLQLVAFTDIGYTMKGLYPTAENVVNLIRINDNPSNVSVYLEESLAMGYGLGFRTRFLGYFFRTDIAWNMGGGKKPILHLSLATDF